MVLSVGKTEAQVDRPVREAMAEMLNIPLIGSVHDCAHRVLSNWRDRRHVGWLALVSLVAKIIAQALQNFVLPRLQQLSQMLPSNIPKEGYQILKSSV